MPFQVNPNILGHVLHGRMILLRDALPRPVTELMNRLPVPRVYLPVLNMSPYPITYPERDPGRAANCVLRLTNGYRRKYGRPNMRLSETLCKAARRHCIDQASLRDVTHSGSDGSSLTDRLDRVGYRLRVAAENVACGYDSEEHVFNGWRTSPGHRHNLLKDNVEDMGVWVVQGDDGLLYWTQIVAKRY